MVAVQKNKLLFSGAEGVVAAIWASVSKASGSWSPGSQRTPLPAGTDAPLLLSLEGPSPG